MRYNEIEVNSMTRLLRLIPAIFLDEMLNVSAIPLRQCRALDEEYVLRIELGAPGKVVRTSDDRVIDHQDLVMHEVVPAGRTVRG